MLYVDEDFFPSFGRFNHIKTNLCSNDQINIVILEDQNISPSNYWYIDEDFNPILLEELSELNMGTCIIESRRWLDWDLLGSIT
jgi:uncharacterized protein YukJ